MPESERHAIQVEFFASETPIKIHSRGAQILPASTTSRAESEPQPNLVTIASQGGWWCDACDRMSGPTDDTVGNVQQKCEACGKCALRWIPPATR